MGPRPMRTARSHRGYHDAFTLGQTQTERMEQTVSSLYLRLINWAREQEGQTMVEYILIIALIAIAITIAMFLLSGGLSQYFGPLAGYLNGLTAP